MSYKQNAKTTELEECVQRLQLILSEAVSAIRYINGVLAEHDEDLKARANNLNVVDFPTFPPHGGEEN